MAERKSTDEVMSLCIALRESGKTLDEIRLSLQEQTGVLATLATISYWARGRVYSRDAQVRQTTESRRIRGRRTAWTPDRLRAEIKALTPRLEQLSIQQRLAFTKALQLIVLEEAAETEA